MDIKESRLVQIESRIITADDLYRLADTLYKEYKSLVEDDSHVRLSYTAYSDDGSVFESDNPELFSGKSPIFSKKINAVEMGLTAYNIDRSVTIKLNQTNRTYTQRNYISCKGLDSKWVNGMLINLQEIVDGFNPQNQFVSENRLWIHIISSIGIGAVIITILVPFISFLGVQSAPANNPIRIFLEENPLLRHIFLYFSYFLVGNLPASFLVDRLEELWPKIEFQVGPPHKQFKRKKRSIIASIFVLGIIPFVIQLLYDLISQLHLFGG